MSTFTLTPGNAVTCYINTHRAAWDGSICDNPTEWNCAATPGFRRDYCARGTSRCCHLHTFANPSPRLSMDDYGAGWALRADPHVLDDQILLILAREGSEPTGLCEEVRRRYKVAGAYRVKEVRRIEQGHRVLWEVHPYENGWTRFHHFTVDSPRLEQAGGPYIKQIDRGHVLRVFAEIAAAATRPDPGWVEEVDAPRFEAFHANLEAWLDDAARTLARVSHRSSWRALAAQSVRAVADEGCGPLAHSEHPCAEDLEASSRIEFERFDGDPLCERPPLLEDGRREWVRHSYGDAVLEAVQVASLTKEILILSGSPGMGKSYLAARLLDDPKRERTVVVPVGSNWRGSGDLFKSARFVEFLTRASAAWHAGDRRARVVVFEEFNLSEPERWLSDVLVASQSSEESDRYLVPPTEPATRVFLSPAVRFVATVNQDHTVRPLSSRVLDRAALVDIRRGPRQSLACAGLRILEDMTIAITDLDFLVRAKGANFSLRSALSLRACLEEVESLGLGEWDAVDLVLVQEVLSKVRLASDDPIDEEVLQDLMTWQDRHGNHLSRCSNMISEWEESLRAGMDVSQA